MSTTLSLLTLVHVGLSLAAIGAGFLWLGLALHGRPLGPSAAVFLATTGLTTGTGFLFPFNGFTPAIGVGVVSVPIIMAACVAAYAKRLRGWWSAVFAITAMAGLYLNSFVLVAQMSQKVPALQSLAPTQREAPFACAQLGLLLVFIALTIRLVRQTRTPRPAAVPDASTTQPVPVLQGVRVATRQGDHS